MPVMLSMADSLGAVHFSGELKPVVSYVLNKDFKIQVTCLNELNLCSAVPVYVEMHPMVK